MYIRTTKRKNKDGSVVAYYQLAHNERNPRTGKPVARVIHSFGRADRLDRGQLVRLCRSIARVCGLQVLDPADAEGELSEAGVSWPDDLKLIRTLAYGVPLAAEALWQRLGVGETLRRVCKDERVPERLERALFAMTANRLCAPESKLGVWERWLDTVYLPSGRSLRLREMYEAMDLLCAHSEAIEKEIFFRTAHLFNLSVDLVLYDTTTAGFEIDDADSAGPRQFGRAKEGGWGPQVKVALAVTREGLPVRSWVFPGNMSDVDTVETVKADLRGWSLGRAIFVADAGMNSKTNRAKLAEACGKYLLATRMASVKEIRRDVLSRPGRYRKIRENLLAKEVVLGEGDRRRRYILCLNPREARRQKIHREAVVKFLEEELAGHVVPDAAAQWAAKLRASKRCNPYLSVSEDGKIFLDRDKVRKRERYDGKWVVETNDDEISAEDAALGYRGLMVIERCFRSLKKPRIRMTPMCHRLERRIDAHVKICVLALLIERTAEISLDAPWSEIRRGLEALQVSEFRSGNFRFFRRNELQPKTRRILKSLKIHSPKSILDLEKTPENP
jgi:hypothetical protein